MTKITPEHKNEIEDRLLAGESLRSIAKLLGVTYQTLQYHRRQWGCPLLRKGRTSGKDHASWTGGEFIDRWGYKMIRAPERGMCNPYVPEHILIAEQMIGRQLIKHKEVVHHINGIKSDNREENLLVCTRSEHRTLHGQLGQIGYELFRQGIIVFENGKYALKC